MTRSHIRTVLAVAASVLASSSGLLAQAERGDTAIVAAIRRLDGAWWAESLPNFEPFYSAPARAAELLIQSLKTIPPGNYWQKHQPAVVWCVRALRSLTGLDFRGRTERKVTEEDSLPMPDSTGTVPFFELASIGWDRIVVAPIDAQEQIIDEWRRWYTRYGRTFKYVNNRAATRSWYF